MKLQIETMLLSAQSPQDNDLQITWDVTAAANVREYGSDSTTPGELLIEDIEIIDVRCWSIRYGTFGSVLPGHGMRLTKFITQYQTQQRLDWLNSVLHDRDDWTEAIRIAATREHMRQRDQIRN